MTTRKGKILFGLAMVLSSIQAKANICWDGVYAGVEAGQGWGRFNYVFDNPDYFNTLGPAVLGSDFNLSANGLSGGAYSGYLHQLNPRLAIGIEGNLLATSQYVKISSPYFPLSDNYKTSLHTLVNAKLRLAYTCGPWLWSVSGGYAGGQIRLSLYDNDSPFSAAGTDWLNGWLIGLAVDYRVKQQVSLGLTYDYSQLNMYNKTLTCNHCNNDIPALATPIVYGGVTVQTLLARLTYYFN